MTKRLIDADALLSFIGDNSSCRLLHDGKTFRNPNYWIIDKIEQLATPAPQESILSATLTTEQMVKELDAKFNGFSDGFNKLDREIGINLVNFRCGKIQVIIQADFSKPCDISFDDWENSAIHFKQETLEKTLEKVHDYLIVKGGDL